jgi:signal transduction histidine kinase
MRLGRLRESVRAEVQTQIEDCTRELAELARYLQSAREDERNRLARALHDELGSLLTAAKLDAARIKTRVSGVSPKAVERSAHLNGTLNSIVALARRITGDLRPSTLGNLGLMPALEILARLCNGRGHPHRLRDASGGADAGEQSLSGGVELARGLR